MLPDSSNALEVGRLGEHVAWQILQKKAADGSLSELRPFRAADRANEWSVRWVNESGESGRPYDLVCQHPVSGDVFVEVKATATAGKTNFEISTAELMAARDNVNYLILRAFNVGSQWSACSFDLIEQPWKMLESKGSKLFMQL